jgi:hypothetical protein
MPATGRRSAFPGDPDDGGVPAGRPGAGPAWPERLPGFVLEADPRAGQRR